MHGFAVWCLAFAFVGTRWGQKKELLGVSHAYGNRARLCGKAPYGQHFLTAALVLIFLILSGSQNANALPAFARKYGLRCSACHESWPMLNYFGQKFKDNGYQLMNDRDA